MVIYIDVLLAVNWWIDFILLCGVARFAGIPAKVWRIVVASLIGGLFSFVMFLPALSAWITLLIKLGTAAVMVLLAFGKTPRQRFFKALLLLFAVSAGFAGLCSTLYFFVAPARLYVFNGAVYYAVSPWLLIGLTVLCYGIMSLVDYIGRRRAPQGKAFCVLIRYRGRTLKLRCLYDSGNHLVEPFSNRPVILVERSTLAGLLDVPENEAELMPGDHWRIIPFSTISGKGTLPAFLPEELFINGKKMPLCYIAACERLGRGDYQGLIGTALGNCLSQLEGF